MLQVINIIILGLVSMKWTSAYVQQHKLLHTVYVFLRNTIVERRIEANMYFWQLNKAWQTYKIVTETKGLNISFESIYLIFFKEFS